MTLEVRFADQNIVYPDGALISIGELRAALLGDRKAHTRPIFAAAKRSGSRRSFLDQSVRGSRQFYEVDDVPKIIAELAKARIQQHAQFPQNTETDFQFVAPSGATIIYCYPKK